MERVELYLYSPSGPLWPVLGWILVMNDIPVMYSVVSKVWLHQSWRVHCYTSFRRRTVKTRLIHCLRHVLCFISFRTKLSATLLFQWFLSLKCHSFNFTGKNVFGSYFTKLCRGLVDKVSCLSSFVMLRKEGGFLRIVWPCIFLMK